MNVGSAANERHIITCDSLFADIFLCLSYSKLYPETDIFLQQCLTAVNIFKQTILIVCLKILSKTLIILLL